MDASIKYVIYILSAPPGLNSVYYRLPPSVGVTWNSNA